MSHAQKVTLSAADCDRVKVELVSALTGVDLYPDAAVLPAANQLIRTNVHPDVYATVGRLQRYLQGDAKRLRLVAEQLGYGDAFPATLRSIVSPVVEVYEHSHEYLFIDGDITRHDVAETYIECVSIAALYNEVLLRQFAAAVFSVLTHEYVHYNTRAFHSHHDAHTRTTDHVRQALDTLQRHDARMRYAPTLNESTGQLIEPIHAHVHHNNALQALRIPLALSVEDPLTDAYTITYSDPHPVDRHEMRSRVSIPQNTIHGSGIGLHLTFHTQPLQFFLSPAVLESIASNGSAVGAVIGAHGDVRLHPEYLGEHATIDPIARIRVNHAVVEVQKLHPHTNLTLFV